VTVDGVVFHEHRLVYNTKGAAAGAKWGAGGNVNGTRTLLCGAQALGMADIGTPEWNEKEFQYGSQQGINVDKMFGLLKPKFYSIYDKSVRGLRHRHHRPLHAVMKNTKAATVGLVWTGVGAIPTQGQVRLIVKYIIDNRAHSTEG
jgi:hypothetical protein